jgi:hypothetical protein
MMHGTNLNSIEMGYIITEWSVDLSNVVHSRFTEFENTVPKYFWFNGSRNILIDWESICFWKTRMRHRIGYF